MNKNKMDDKLRLKTDEIYTRMLLDPEQTEHDIGHLTRVLYFARTIGKEERLDEERELILEVSAILHDIACPELRKKYGSANGKLQEKYGPDKAREFLAGTGLGEKQLERICYLIGHHHTPSEADGMDYQILIEADYLANALEEHYSKENVETEYKTYFKTESGKKILKELLL